MAYNVSYTTLPTFDDTSIGKVWSYGPYGTAAPITFASSITVNLMIIDTDIRTSGNPGYMYFLLSNSTASTAVDTRTAANGLNGRQSLQILAKGVYLICLNVRVANGSGRVLIETGSTSTTASATIFDQIHSNTVIHTTQILSVSSTTYLFISVGNETNSPTQFVNAKVQICRIA